MSRFVTSVLLLIGLCLGQAFVVAAQASELQRSSTPSPNLKRDFPYLVYLPDGYDSGKQRYPVLYLLHGAGGDETDWDRQAHIKLTADALIAKGAIPPSIIVMPGCPTCWWVDGRQDKAETAFWNDLVPAIDQTYRTIARRDGRFIAGVSAGGFGAVRYGLRYPDRVGAVAALSPAVYSETPPADSAARRQPPFTMPDGRFSDTAWTAKNYPALLPAYFDGTQRVPMYLVSGDDDRLGIAFEAALLHKRLAARSPNQVELRIVDGEHTWKVWSSVLPEAMAYVFRQSPALVVQAPPKANAAVTTVDVR